MIARGLLAVVAPALLAATLCAIAWRPWRGGAAAMRAERAPSVRAHSRAAWLPLALGSAFFLAFAAGAGWLHIPPWRWPLLPPAERWQWIAALAVLASVAGLVAALIASRPATLAMTIVTAGTAAAALRFPWMGPPAILGGIIGAVVCAVTLSIEVSARRAGAASLALALAVPVAALAILLGQSFIKMSLAAAGFTTTLAAVAVIAALAPGATLARGAAPVIGALLPALAVIGAAYDEAGLPVVCFALPVSAPLLVAAADVLAPRGARPMRLAAARIGAALTPSACALAIACWTMYSRTRM